MHYSQTAIPRAPISVHGSSNRFLIYHEIPWNRHCCCSSTDWKPSDRILVVKGPGRYNREERERGASECNVDCELDVLQKVSDKEGDDLDGMLGHPQLVRGHVG